MEVVGSLICMTKFQGSPFRCPHAAHEQPMSSEVGSSPTFGIGWLVLGPLTALYGTFLKRLGLSLRTDCAHYSLLSRMFLDILIKYLYYHLCLCTTFAWRLCFGWLLVLGLYKENFFYKFFNVSLWLHSFCGQWQGWVPVHQFNHTSWMAVVTPTDRRSTIVLYSEGFGGVLVLSFFFLIFYWYKDRITSLSFSLYFVQQPNIIWYKKHCNAV